MQAPPVGDSEALDRVDRVSRQVNGHGRFIQEFVRQVDAPSQVVVFTDSDHA